MKGKSKRPKTVKGYLNMLLRICHDTSIDLKNVTEEEESFIASIRAVIQNELGEDVDGVMKKHGLEWSG